MNISYMRLKHLPLFLALVFYSAFLSAKSIGMEISYAEFMDKDNQAYLELYFALAGNSVEYTATENGKFTGGVEVTVTLLQDSNIVSADKFRMTSPQLDDTSGISDVFINQVRFPVERGAYTLAINLRDMNDPDEEYYLEQGVETVLGTDELASSELLLLDSYKKSTGENMFSKSGYDLIPLVSSGDPYFNEGVNNISFYTEIYNTSNAIGENEPYVVKYYIKDADVNQVLNEYASFSKKTASDVEPILASFSIAELKTGNYELVLEALNREGEVILSDSKFFFRKNSIDPVVSADVSDEDIRQTFVGEMGNLDSVFLFIKYLYPISTDTERNYQKLILRERDLNQMKRYFYAFWNQRNEMSPGKAWKKYYSKVRTTNELYGSSLRPGYMSDRGRVFLTYGKPDMIEARRLEPSMPPYEIWQYNHINTPYAPKQTNRMFVFAEFNPSTNEYELLHSTAIGEMQRRRWQYDMQQLSSGNNSRSIDDNNTSGDGWGDRTRNNIIFGGTGSDRNRR